MSWRLEIAHKLSCAVTVRMDRRLVEVGLKEVLAEDMFREAAAKGPLKDTGNRENAGGDKVMEGDPNKVSSAAKPGSRKKAKEDDKARHITDFFAR